MANENNVYALIAKTSAELAQRGISKDNKNVQQGYKFRGIDDVYNALAPIMSKYGLCMLPRVISCAEGEKPSKNGGVIKTVVMQMEFDFVSAHDGSKHTVSAVGEAMDSGDKATNKAMSAAYKYAAFMSFCIPTEGDNDADAHTHSPVYQPKQDTAPKAPSKMATENQITRLKTMVGEFGAENGLSSAETIQLQETFKTAINNYIASTGKQYRITSTNDLTSGMYNKVTGELFAGLCQSALDILIKGHVDTETGEVV